MTSETNKSQTDTIQINNTDDPSDKKLFATENQTDKQISETVEISNTDDTMDKTTLQQNDDQDKLQVETSATKCCHNNNKSTEPKEVGKEEKI